jgi:hypothetical protein
VKTPLKPQAARIIAGFMAELDGEEVSPGTEHEAETIFAWLGLATDARCRCGRKLRRFEMLNGSCWECSQIILARENRAPTQPPLLERLKVPPRYQACTIAAWRGKIPHEVTQWAKNPHDTLLLSGSVGCGKTHLALIALAIAAEHGRWGEWVSARGLVRDLYADGMTPERELWRRLTRRQVLLLDDLGGEPGISWASDQIAALLDERFANRKALIVTTNLTPEALYSSDARMGSRLSVGVSYAMSGSDRRLE